MYGLFLVSPTAGWSIWETKTLQNTKIFCYPLPNIFVERRERKTLQNIIPPQRHHNHHHQRHNKHLKYHQKEGCFFERGRRRRRRKRGRRNKRRRGGRGRRWRRVWFSFGLLERFFFLFHFLVVGFGFVLFLGFLGFWLFKKTCRPIVYEKKKKVGEQRF